MSDALPLSEVMAQVDRKAHFEQQIFLLSPLGTLWTSTAIFLLLAGSFALVADLSHEPLFAHGTVTPQTRSALVFSLLVATALGIPRYTRIKDRSEVAEYPPLLLHGEFGARQFALLTPSNARLPAATAIGLLVGLIASYLFLPRAPVEHGAVGLVFAWFAIVTTLLAMLFVRGVELTRSGGNGTRKFIDEEVKIDLLRIDHLQVIGRSAARTALIWFTISAVTCLFFVSSEPTMFSVALIVGCAAMGIWIFVRTMEHVHKRILAVKAAELERVRARIDELRQNMHEDADAATKLQGALAYEARIVAVHEWPFDQPTLLRVGASALILTVPWFGQAIAGVVVDKLGNLMH
jgi:hypothetical protein